MALTPDQRTNRRKFLDFIGASEGADYNTIVGGGRFSDYSRHPNIMGMPDSTAAGKYQITYQTYNALRKKYGLGPEVDPASQDEMALRLIQEKGALADIDAGNWRAAVRKLGPVWASFPSSTANQPHKSWEYVDRYFLNGGSPSTGEADLTPMETDLLKRNNMTPAQQGAFDLLTQANSRIAQYEKDMADQGAQAEKDKAELEQKLAAGDEATRQQIMQQPIQPERGLGQRALGAILGGRTEEGFQNETDLRHQQIQKRHDELTQLALTRTQRLADAYMKMGDIVNAVKYTSAAQKLAQAQREKSEALQMMTQLGVAETYAGGRMAAANRNAPFMQPDEYSAAFNKAVNSHRDKKGNLIDQPGLKAELVQMRHLNQTPLSYVQNLYSTLPGEKGGFLGWGAKKPLFDVHSDSDWNTITNGLNQMFTPEELTPEVVKQVRDWVARARGGQAAAEPQAGQQTAQQSPLEQEGAAVRRLRLRAVEIVKKLDEISNSGGTAGALHELKLDQVDRLQKELRGIQGVLKTYGQTLQFGTNNVVGGISVEGRQ